MTEHNLYCENISDVSSFAEELIKTAKNEKIPLSGTFELTPRCDFNCKMCYVHLNDDEIKKFGTELPVSEWIRLAEEARNAGMIYLCITGGEPLMYEGFEEFYRAVSQMGFLITLQTNASMITDRAVRLFENSVPNLVKTTIYGSNNSIYRDVCGIENGFSRVDSGIKQFLSMGVPVELVTTVIKENRDDLNNIAEYAENLNLPLIINTTVNPSARGAKQDKNSFLEESDFPNFESDVKNMLSLPKRKKDDRPCDRCRGRGISFWITWNGMMRFCSFMNEPDIDVKNVPFYDSWKRLLCYEEGLRWPDECYSCEIREYCHLCAGALASRSGSIHKTDKKLCNDLKRYLDLSKNF